MSSAGFRIFISAAVFMAFSIITTPEGICGDAGKLVSKGNREFTEGDYTEAIDFYEKASVEKPESPVIHFNKGGALYKSGDYAGASDEFRAAAGKTKDLKLEAKAWYNLGNCSFMDGRRQTDSDMEKALESYRESVSLYQAALEKDSTLTDAAVNMEVARLVIKDLLDRIKKRQEQMEKQREKMKEVVDSLVSAARDQGEAIQRGREVSEDKEAGSSGWREASRELGEKQDDISERTGEAADKLKEIAGDNPPDRLKEAGAHIDSSLAAQDEAASDINRLRPEDATGDQERSLEQIKKAIEALTDNKGGQQNQQQKSGGEQQQKGEEGQEKPENQQKRQEEEAGQKKNETAYDILAQEKENRDKRNKEARSGYRRVDKDW